MRIYKHINWTITSQRHSTVVDKDSQKFWKLFELVWDQIDGRQFVNFEEF